MNAGEKITTVFSEASAFRSVVTAREKGSRDIRVSGLAGSAKTVLVAALWRKKQETTLMICPTEVDAERAVDDFSFLLGADRVRHLRDQEILPYESGSPDMRVVESRLAALLAMMDEEPVVVVASLRAASRRLPPPRVLAGAMSLLKVGGEIEPEAFQEHLAASGYERVQRVEFQGTFGVRGGIVDVFSPGQEYPVRVDLWGTEIESLRDFDPLTQRSLQQREEVRILPASEVVLSPEILSAAQERLAEWASGDESDLDELGIRIAAGTFFQGIEQHLPLFYGKGGALSDYVPSNALIVLDEPRHLEQEGKEFWDEVVDLYGRRRRSKQFAVEPPLAFQEPRLVLRSLAPKGALRMSRLPENGDGSSILSGTASQDALGSNLELLGKRLKSFARQRQRVFILSGSEGQRARLEEVLGDVADGVHLAVGSLLAGFALEEVRLQILTDHEIFGRYRRRRALRQYKGKGPVGTPDSLKTGDHVVHVNHGVGRYVGTRRLHIDGRETECLELEYAQGGKLYLPVQQIDLLERFTAVETGQPALHSLGSTSSWERTKSKVRRATKEVAKELLRTYAVRSSREGHSFNPDTPWQRELETSFVYEETPDQRAAIDDVKTDMESARPMDRLVCGDVGYGKTEVAVRAAFKAVMDSKQVAILVPTTVLAQQHLVTFRERLAEYPVQVEMLSRFKTPTEQDQIVHRLHQGTVDIIIGTHRLLQKDVGFRDLGLLVIDEEHRFGVRHKEKLKQFRELVDVLTLTATPIPRTLYMSMVGARDVSIINTPPRDRVPVETHVLAFDERVIGNALRREMDRGGQCFVMHNRVRSIEATARWVSDLIPDARITVAHGQMREKDLERIMGEFIDRRYDILVSTMIIESGLDMPNVNTLIVDRADKLGLAQLYQLRGRVGRSTHRAYAYLLVPPEATPPRDAERRLATIAELSGLGGGYRIALKDLEIRGAGNLLGAEQHGFMMEVGFDMYCRLLREAVGELSDEEPESDVSARLEVDIPAYLPDDYVEDPEERILVYRRLVGMRRGEEVEDLGAELQDRFGPLAQPASHLLGLQAVKLLAQDAGVELVALKGQELRLVFAGQHSPSRRAIEGMVSEIGFPMDFSSRRGFSVRIELPGDDPEERILLAKKALKPFVACASFD
jgi:transcription-repair coupling factor (superfamily II helicase)